jgi:hypothetical protein
MSNSPLSFQATTIFRKELLVRNLKPYTVAGFFIPNTGNRNTQYTPRDLSVVDSTNEFVNPRTNTSYSNEFYRLNSFGPEGGYFDVSINNKLPVKPNQGEYNPNDTNMDLVNEFFIDTAFIENRYGPEGGYNQMVIIDDIQNNNKLYLPYWELTPVNFVPSSYAAYNIFNSDNPIGTDGLLSQDSSLAKISATELKKQFAFRVNIETSIKTVGTINMATFKDPYQTSLLVSGREKIYYQNWKITVSDEPNSSTDFGSRLQGTYYPTSPIPGDYFAPAEINGGENRQTLSALNTVNRLFGNALGPIITNTNNPSITFIQNTGNAQRSSLFQNLELNRYQPSYNKDNTNQNTGQSSATLNLTLNGTQPVSLVGGYYVGSKNAEPALITSPPNQVPVNAFGKQQQAPVFGNSELGILYEGNQNQINFGLAGKSFTDGGGIDGDFVWISPKYRADAGFRATPGGGAGTLDDEYNLISSKYQSSQSTNIDFKPTSILDETQRLINSADSLQGIARLKHVGNAINQVSKVFNDGYKELTKGSKVLSYTDNTTGIEVGREYCRIFAKDTPYYTFKDLQKTDGITTSGRRFTNSVLDRTYNLNIAPMKNPGSTNIQPNARGQLVAKKYMFSIENLAWRTSSRPGFTYDDLPSCERGPNGGRVMWFPPYDLSFSDSSNANFGSTSFLGRPEPIYTYKDTSRSGTLSWKIIVDHPSIMNVIVNKQLKGINKQRVDSILDSFFAGCVKYDIYELAKKFNTIPIADLFTYQEIINSPRLTPEELIGVGKEIPVDGELATGGANSMGATSAAGSGSVMGNPPDLAADFKGKYSEFGFYFDNDIPKPNTTPQYDTTYDSYIGSKSSYTTEANNVFNSIGTYCKANTSYCNEQKNVGLFFDSVVQSNYTKFSNGFIDDLYNVFKQNADTTVTLELVGSASALGDETYNLKLSERRIASVKQFLENYKTTTGASLKEYFSKISIKEIPKGETTNVSPLATDGLAFSPVDCNQNVEPKGTFAKIYSINAMACRRVILKVVNIVTPTKTTQEQLPDNKNAKGEENKTPQKFEIQRSKTLRETSSVDYTQKLKDGIGKRILRNLLTECDYFEVIKDEAPMIYDSIREKIRYFNPAFHSMTPEGLNSRLTFLNQCVRPGETIPVIGTDGKPKYNDALNTSFGTPPILVLRIGDFYHTKIVPDGGVSFSYENNLLDLNPEGIGVQPMIVKVTMNFKIIGGMGLAKPIEQLQNALSFNYYANTEIYDERATPTEDTTIIDKSIIDDLIAQQPSKLLENSTPQVTNDGGDTIGEIVTNIPAPAGQVGQTGEIVYKSIMDKLLDETPKYFEAVVNKLESIFKEYNYGIVQILDIKRDYTKGTLFNDDDINSVSGDEIFIYGKPNYESDIDQEFTTYINNINNGNNPLIKYMSEFFKDSNNVKNPNIDILKKNMVQYTESMKSQYKQGITTNIQDLTQLQQTYVQLFRKVNLLIKKTDGKLLDTNSPRVYNLISTNDVAQQATTSNTYDELKTDYLTFKLVFDGYNKVLTDKQVAFFMGTNPTRKYVFSEITDVTEANFYLIMGRILTNKTKKDDFIKSVIKGNLTTVKSPVNFKNKFEKIVNEWENKSTKQFNVDEKKFDQVKKNKKYKDYTKNLKDDTYKKGKVRKFNYTTVKDQAKVQVQETKIKELYQQKSTESGKTSFLNTYKFN